MFTGVVQELGTVERVTRKQGAAQLHVTASRSAQDVVLGESIAVNGVCLSVVRASRGLLTFDMVPETRRATTLGALKAGSRVNLERSLRLVDRLNGHMVLGHVDGVGRVRRISRQGSDVTIGIIAPRTFRQYVVPKGSIAVEGVSLTIGPASSKQDVTVFLIPETLRRTNLGLLQVGTPVNLELDYLAKLVWHFCHRRK